MPAVRRITHLSLKRNVTMSLIKELVDLVSQLNKSITDSKIRELLLPLKEKTLEVQQDQLRIEMTHAQEMTELANANSDLQQQLQKLKTSDSEFTEHSGAYFKKDGNGGYHKAVYCGRCKSPAATANGRNPRDVFLCSCGWRSSFTMGMEPQIRQSLP